MLKKKNNQNLDKIINKGVILRNYEKLRLLSLTYDDKIIKEKKKKK